MSKGNFRITVIIFNPLFLCKAANQSELKVWMKKQTEWSRLTFCINYVVIVNILMSPQSIISWISVGNPMLNMFCNVMFKEFSFATKFDEL